ncbi:hypothetical protein MARPU_13055 [Marichromatium purpuratum 984]|uniref:Uncharacterized protein n=1 Tax=Marichromatium purpuratum 984 TaxID=765910 RepID=W0E4C0_MARPU|nr:hypothetical protein MARPU_13055 [Marichromatium purpuratum 984]
MPLGPSFDGQSSRISSNFSNLFKAAVFFILILDIYMLSKLLPRFR